MPFPLVLLWSEFNLLIKETSNNDKKEKEYNSPHLRIKAHVFIKLLFTMIISKEKFLPVFLFPYFSISKLIFFSPNSKRLFSSKDESAMLLCMKTLSLSCPGPEPGGYETGCFLGGDLFLTWSSKDIVDCVFSYRI